jgi:acylpyruvate hydrolase
MIQIRIGRNYADHAKELGNAVPKEPFFFLKPTTSYVDDGGVVEIPKGIECHFEGKSCISLSSGVYLSMLK